MFMALTAGKLKGCQNRVWLSKADYAGYRQSGSGPGIYGLVQPLDGRFYAPFFMLRK